MLCDVREGTGHSKHRARSHPAAQTQQSAQYGPRPLARASRTALLCSSPVAALPCPAHPTCRNHPTASRRWRCERPYQQPVRPARPPSVPCMVLYCIVWNHAAQTTGASTCHFGGGLPKARRRKASLNVHRLVSPDGCKYAHRFTKALPLVRRCAGTRTRPSCSRRCRSWFKVAPNN